MSDMHSELMICPHCYGPLDVKHDARDHVTIAKPVVDDLRAAGWVMLTKAEHETLQRVVSAAKELVAKGFPSMLPSETDVTKVTTTDYEALLNALQRLGATKK